MCGGTASWLAAWQSGRLAQWLSGSVALDSVTRHCSVSRVYWSTRDVRRRCVYTCRIVELRPTDVTPPDVAPDLVVADLRVVHDVHHADYDATLLRQFEATQLKWRETAARLAQQRLVAQGTTATAAQVRGLQANTRPCQVSLSISSND